MHQSGFVSIIGKPNAGKSTLLNVLIGEKLSIVTPKAQTTRHKISGILNHQDYQIIFSDTPGILQPKYKMHEAMMKSVKEGIKDSEVILLLIDVQQKIEENDEIFQKIKNNPKPLIVVVNKIDLSTQEMVVEQMKLIEKILPGKNSIPVSATTKFNLDKLLEEILNLLPENPPYYPKDELTDRTERFLVSEIIREKIFMLYHEEVPYSIEVVVTEYTDKETLTKISAEIYVNKESQKPIIIGKGGTAIKRLGIIAREEIEKFIGRKVFLDLTVKEREGWRENEDLLKRLGY